LDELKFKRWINNIANNSGEKIEGSDAFVSIYSSNYHESPQAALELGIAVMTDKPIGIIVLDGQKVSENIKRLAYAVEYVSDNSAVEMARASKRILDKIKGTSKA